MFKGHAVRGAIFGFLFFLFIALDLLFFGVIPLDSALLTILPLVGIVVGLAWAAVAPLGAKGTTGASADVPPPAYQPPPA
ncbi:MAG TPA: hypothetical protein VFV00_13205 [Acidimicrobiales bacterium]|nr:hypothetical protein [Acidimicrobiales bacterium]